MSLNTLCRLLLALWLGLALAPAQAQAPLRVGVDTPVLQVWPALRLLVDSGGTLDLGGAIARRAEFQPVDPAHASLGLRPEPVWLHLPLSVDAAAPAQWVLDINYPVLNRVEVYQGGHTRPLAVLGNQVPFDQRPLGGRSLAVPLTLEPGQPAELWLRVQTAGALVLPVTLSQPAAFHRAALQEQLLQGLLSGLALTLLLYSLAQWLALRDTLFLKYALLITGSLSFSVFQFGLGNQLLWTDAFWFERHAGGLTSLAATCGSFLFIEHALRAPGTGRAFGWLMRGGAALAALLALAYAAGVLPAHAVAGIVSVMGLLPALLGLPGAARRAWRGDTVGATFLLAWLVYFVATALIIGVIRGALPVNFWTLHAFQFGATLDMLLFMRVLGLRTREIRVAAERHARERDAMRSLAHTDPLTGLPNRRLLDTALRDELARAGPSRRVAVFALDLDGFKAVNDRHGHAVGDVLLAAVAQRLREHTRTSDLVARVGGDEFVMMAAGLSEPRAAEDLGHKLLEAFRAPFEASGHTIALGLTAGYALAPDDGTDLAELLQRADAALYEGKRAGKHCLRRAS